VIPGPCGDTIVQQPLWQKVPERPLGASRLLVVLVIVIVIVIERNPEIDYDYEDENEEEGSR
jgi:hypothetical protein